MDLLETSQDAHWCYASKSRALLQCVTARQPQRILDVGAGSGYFAKTLLRNTAATGAVCVDAGYTHDWSETYFEKPIVFSRRGTTDDADLILLMDVLEHVDDDVGFFGHYVRSSRRGTRFIVSVPAFKWLWSAHDEFLEHRRRYMLGGLLGLLSSAGLESVSGFYFFAGVFPLVAAKRILGRL